MNILKFSVYSLCVTGGNYVIVFRLHSCKLYCIHVCLHRQYAYLSGTLISVWWRRNQRALFIHTHIHTRAREFVFCLFCQSTSRLFLWYHLQDVICWAYIGLCLWTSSKSHPEDDIKTDVDTWHRCRSKKYIHTNSLSLPVTWDVMPKKLIIFKALTDT